MNGGGPATPLSSTGGPLRAVRRAPVLVDDLALEARLSGVASTGNAGDAETVRWTRAWLVVWQGVLHAAGVIGTAEPWSVPVHLDEVPTLKGDPLGARRARAIALLEAAGLLRRTAGGDSAVLDEGVFTPHRAGLEVDWGTVCRVCRYEPAALLVLRALVEVVVPADTPTPVSLRELAGRTGYAEKQVRVALRRLAEAGVISVSETPGQATRYWLAPLALGRRAAPLPETPSSSPPEPVHAVNAPTSAPAAPAPGTTPVLRLALNGVTLAVVPGLEVDVTLDPDGLPRVTIRPPSR